MAKQIDIAQQEAMYRAQIALEKLMQIQRKVKACAEALRDTRDTKERGQLIKKYADLLDEWDIANAHYTEVNGTLLSALSEE